MPLTPEQLKICKALFKPLIWEAHPAGDIASVSGGHSFVLDTRRNRFEFIGMALRNHRFSSEKEAKAAAEQHYYETMEENVNWEKKINVEK